jgi:hypothetical protein
MHIYAKKTMNKMTIPRLAKFVALSLIACGFRSAHADTGSIAWNNQMPISYQVKIAQYSQCVLSPDTTQYDIGKRDRKVYTLNLNRNACDDGVWISFTYQQTVKRGGRAQLIVGTVKYSEVLNRDSNLVGKINLDIHYPSGVEPNIFRAVCGIFHTPCARQPEKVSSTDVNISVISPAEFKVAVPQ